MPISDCMYISQKQSITSSPVGDTDYVCLSFQAANLYSIYKLIIAKYLQNIKGKEKIMCVYHPIGLLQWVCSVAFGSDDFVSQFPFSCILKKKD